MRLLSILLLSLIAIPAHAQLWPSGLVSVEKDEPTIEEASEPVREPAIVVQSTPEPQVQIARVPLPNRYTAAELRSAIHRVAPNGWQQTSNVSPRSAVWSHLVNDHGFTYSQVNSLSQEEALILHDLAHDGRAPATRSLVPTPERTPGSLQPQETIQWDEFSSMGCANGQCPTVPQRRGLFRGLFSR